MAKEINIYIFTFGKKVNKLREFNSLPLEVGADLRDNFKYSLKDNIGDNISRFNPQFAELTGYYWVWKNSGYKDSDLVGFFHYNKAISISYRKAVSFLENNCKNRWITLKAGYIPGHKPQYIVDNLREILREQYYPYFLSWNKLYDKQGSGHQCRYANMFITDYKSFSEYCCFLFSVLFELYSRIGPLENYSDYDKRYCAFMAERLLSVYLLTNKCKVKECNAKYGNMLLTFSRNYLTHFEKIKTTYIYKRLKQKFGYKSSYIK